MSNFPGNIRIYTNAALQERIAGMQTIWPRFRISACRHPAKVRALVTSAWPRALHAVAATTLSDAAFHKLRTGAVKGLSIDGAGSNAWVQCGMIESPTVDPQCWAILQTLRCVRDCGHRKHVKHTLAGLVPGGSQAPANSFSTALLTRLQTLGWHISPEGTVFDQFGEVCIFSASMSELTFRVHWAWQFVAAQQVSHRLGLRDLQFADAHETRRWLQSLSFDDQELFKKCLDGTHITQDCQAH